MPAKAAKPRSKQVGLALDATNLVLATLRDTARLTPIPFLRDAAGLALGVLEVVQSARDNKDAYTRLATDACNLVYAALIHAEKSSTAISNELQDNLRELQRTLTGINNFAAKQVKRNRIIRAITWKSDLVTIQAYRDSLRQSLDLFGLKSNIMIQESIGQLVMQQEELVNTLKTQPSSPSPPRDAAQEHPREHSSGFHDHFLSPHIHSAQGRIKFTSVAGDVNHIDSSQHITSTNSGNTTNTIITNSNNDFSARVNDSYGMPFPWSAQWNPPQ